MIRRAETGDLSELADMAVKFHAYSPYKDVPFDRPSVARTLIGLMTSPSAAVFVCEEGGICGMMGVTAVPCIFNHEVEIVQEAFWWCEGGDANGLRQASEDWARERGAAIFAMACLENDRVDTMSRLYRRAGFEPRERHFSKAL